MYLSNSLSFLLLPLGTIAAPQPGPVVYALHQNSQRQLPSVPLAPILSPPLRLRAGIIAAESDTNSGAVIQARQDTGGGAVGGSFPFFFGSSAMGIEAPTSVAAAPKSTPTQTTSATSSTQNYSTNCYTVSNDSLVNALDLFEVQNISISSTPNSTFNLWLTDRVKSFDNRTICDFNTSCPVPFPGLHLQASMNNTGNSTNATSYATFTDLPSGSFINCSNNAFGLVFERPNNQTDTIFAVTLIHGIYDLNSNLDMTILRSANLTVDLNAGPQVPNLDYIGRSNVTVGSDNNTWTWVQSSVAWFTSVRNQKDWHYGTPDIVGI